jgi:hypothetical protein
MTYEGDQLRSGVLSGRVSWISSVELSCFGKLHTPFFAERRTRPRLALRGRKYGFPRFPVELSGFGKLHTPFFAERRTRGLVSRREAGNPGSGNDQSVSDKSGNSS